MELNQCRSGGSVGARFGRGPCIGYAQGNNPGWSNGALNADHSLYRMNDFVPFRAVITDLTPGNPYVIRIGYDAVVSGWHAYDYLGSYDASEFPNGLLQPPTNPPPNKAVVPCGGTSGTVGPHACGPGPEPGTPSERPVPTDGGTTFPNGHHPTNTGHFSAWGATLRGIAFFHCTSPHPCGPIGPTGNASYVPRQINVRFIADGPTVVLAWGGHLASILDWGVGRTFWERGSGCSVHMRVVALGAPGSATEPGGNHDRCIQPAALADPPTITTLAAPSSVPVNEPVTDTATLTGTRGLPTGQVRFFVCGPAATAPNCSTGGTDLGTDGVVDVPQGSTTGQASIQFTPTAAGHYCFRVVYTPTPGAAPYDPATHTNTGNECFVAAGALLTVTKLCDPANDPGLFDFLVSGAPFGAADVPCGGSRGPLGVAAGTHTVDEAAGTGTSLADYTTTFGGDCAGGSITVAAGDEAVCELTNTRVTPPLPPPPASLTLTKVCVPATDPGQFELRVDGAPVSALRCGQSTTAAVGVAPVTHTVSEAGVPPTSLSDYTTVISGDCAANGSITLAPGQAASCTITNTRIPPATTLRVDKVCVPRGDNGRFNLTINGSVAGTGRNVGCPGTTGAVPVAPGTHRVGETGAGGTRLNNYTTVVGGDCAANRTITIAAGRQATCVITNVRAPLRPPQLCYKLTIARRMVTVGNPVPIVAHVFLGGRPVQGIRVFVAGPRVSAVLPTGRLGKALFLLRLQHPGILTLRIRRPFLCPGPHPHRIGILGVSQPSLTG